MSRFISLFLIMLFFAVTVSAESDYSSLTMNELKTIRDSVTSEIMSRVKGDDINFFQGVYISGESIKPGQYSFVCLNTAYGMSISVFKDEASYKDYNASNRSYSDRATYSYATQNLMLGDSYHFTLEEGYILLVEGGDGYVESIQYDWMM